MYSTLQLYGLKIGQEYDLRRVRNLLTHPVDAIEMVYQLLINNQGDERRGALPESHIPGQRSNLRYRASLNA